MQPRVIGGASAQLPTQTAEPTNIIPSFVPVSAPITTENALVVPTTAWSGKAILPQNFGVSLPLAQITQIEKDVTNLSIHSLTMLQIATLASESEAALNKSLGAFLDRIDKGNNPQIFRLVQELNKEVKEQDLGGLADKIINGKPGWWQSMMSKLSAKKRAEAMAALHEELRALVSAKTKKLEGTLVKMEREVEDLKTVALDEAKNFEKLKDNYRARFMEFAAATVFLNTFLAKAKDELAVLKAQEAAGQMPAGLTVNEALDKVQAIESRALAVEGTFTKLPAEQLVVTQIQTATIQSVQEVTTTTGGRFASIRMALVSIHGAMQVQNLQRIAQQGKDLDTNLNNVRNRLATQVVTVAANAPGDNRVAQAEQLKAVVANTQALQAVVEQARIDNEAKFQSAREMLGQARTDLTALGAVIRPDKPQKF